MIPQRVLVPSWRNSQVNKREADGSTIPHLEVLTSNMKANMEAFEEAYPNGSHDAIYICAREKMEDGDYRCCMAAIPVDKNGVGVVEVVLSHFEKVPHVVISHKPSIADVIRRVLKMLAFS